MLIRRSSSGWRMPSRTSRRNSGSSSRKSTPRCASASSPGRDPLLPPKMPAAETVWCGARKGRAAMSGRPSSRPAALWIFVTSIASSNSRGGRMPVIRRAIIVFPAPGGPMKRRLCAPAAATSSARLACSCPRTSEKSATAGVGPAAAGSVAATGCAAPVRTATACASDVTPRTVTSRTSAASPVLHAGMRRRRDAGGRGRGGDREHAADRAHRPVERELAGDDGSGEVAADVVSVGGEHRERDRQIVAGALFAEVGGREVHRDPPRRDLEAGVPQRRAHPVLALADDVIGQPDGGGLRQPRRDVDLDVDDRGVDADERTRENVREHPAEPAAAACAPQRYEYRARTPAG